jgi:hypothetical protein
MSTGSPWTHALCIACWNERHPSTPFNTDSIPDSVMVEMVPCCHCSQLTTSGIYVRDDPKKMACKGKH